MCFELKLQQGVVDHFPDDEEGAGLARAGEGEQLVAVQAVEVGHVAHANLQHVVEVASDQMAVEHEGELARRLLELSEALRCRAVQHHADHDQRAAPDLVRRHHRPHAADIALREKPLGTPMTGGRRGVGALRQFRVGQPAILLQQLEDLQVDAIEVILSGSFFHFRSRFRKED